jgi:hypothetical protein
MLCGPRQHTEISSSSSRLIVGLAAVGLALAVAAPSYGATIITSGIDTYIDDYDGGPPAIMSSGLPDNTGVPASHPIITIPQLDNVCFGAPGLTPCGSQFPTTGVLDGKAPAAGADNAGSGRIAGDGVYGIKWDEEIGLTDSENQGLLWFDIPSTVLDAFQAAVIAGDNPTAELRYNVFDNGSSANMYRMIPIPQPTCDNVGGGAPAGCLTWTAAAGGNEATWFNTGCGGGVDIGGGCKNADADEFIVATATTGYNAIDVTDDVEEWAGGEENLGWGFIANGSSRARLHSFDGGGGATGPTSISSVASVPTLWLSVTVPEPSTGMLITAGFLGLLVTGRKQQARA